MVSTVKPSLQLITVTAPAREAARVEPYTVDIDAVKLTFRNGEEVIVTSSFTNSKNFDVWLSSKDL